MNQDLNVKKISWKDEITLAVPAWVLILFPIAMLFALGTLDILVSVGLLCLFNSAQFKLNSIPFFSGKWRIFWIIVFVLNIAYVPYLMLMNIKR